MKIKIVWEVDDGYVGKSRPKYTTIDTLDYYDTEEEWNNLVEDEKQDIYAEAVDKDFMNSISFYIKGIIKEQ